MTLNIYALFLSHKDSLHQLNEVSTSLGALHCQAKTVFEFLFLFLTLVKQILQWSGNRYITIKKYWHTVWQDNTCVSLRRVELQRTALHVPRHSFFYRLLSKCCASPHFQNKSTFKSIILLPQFPLTIYIEIHENKWTKGTNEDGNLLSIHWSTACELVWIWLRIIRILERWRIHLDKAGEDVFGLCCSQTLLHIQCQQAWEVTPSRHRRQRTSELRTLGSWPWGLMPRSTDRKHWT